MNKLNFFITAIVVLFIASCSKSEDEDKEKFVALDIYPICIDVWIQDANGIDLLNPSTESEIDLKKVVAHYNGKTYDVTEGFSLKSGNTVLTSTRTYLAVFRGLTLEANYYGKYYLEFGEFDGAATWENETVEIDWGNEFGTSVFTFSNKYIKWDYKNAHSIIDRTFKFDGVEYKSVLGEIKLQPGDNNKLRVVE